jgi:hypothetical protein
MKEKAPDPFLCRNVKPADRNNPNRISDFENMPPDKQALFRRKHLINNQVHEFTHYSSSQLYMDV